MKKIKLFILISIIQLFAVGYTFAQSCYELVWSEEFNYSGLPDSTIWTYEVGGGGWGNNELEYYTNKRLENARVQDSMLIIEARKESYSGSQYTSARLITYNNKLSWKYGKIEARMKLPYGQGIWPAFWMMNNTIKEGVSWPGCGEIDIMEIIGGGEGRDDKLYGTIHFSNANNVYEHWGGNYQLPQGIFNDDFHVFGIEWDSTSIQWFVDSIPYYKANITSDFLSEFHGNFFILLNLAVGGNWPGSPNTSTVFPQQLMVDYVRVYQLNAKAEIQGKTNVIKSEKGLVYSTVESNENVYNWKVPDNATIVSGQGTSQIVVDWGCSAGTVTCDITSSCDTYTTELPVEIDPLQIFGNELVDANEENLEYSVLPALNTTYTWTLPSMVSSTLSTDTNVVYLNWGTHDGTIKVITENACGLDSASLDVKIIRQLPYPDPTQPQVIPGTIESVNYDFGGEGVAYHDSEPDNQGTGSRQDEGVDTEANDGSENVGWIETGEWLEYTVNVEEAKTYDAEIRIASPNTTGKFRLLFNGVDKSRIISVPSTGSWSSFSSVYLKDLDLDKTDTLLRVEIVEGGFNLGRMIFADSIKTISLQPELSMKSVQVYPTLTSDYLYIKNAPAEVTYTVTDIAGRRVKSGHLNNNAINVMDIKKGSYLLQLKTNDSLITLKFIKI